MIAPPCSSLCELFGTPNWGLPVGLALGGVFIGINMLFDGWRRWRNR